MKIRFLPYQPHCFAFGGFELQMLTAFEELKKAETAVDKLDVWDRSADFDILHCWGLGLANYENIYWGKKANKKIVVTALLGYYETNYEKLRYLLSSLFYKQRILQEMIENIDAIVVVNEQQADVCAKYFKVKKDKIKIVPNVVDEKFFNQRGQSLSLSNNDGYILSAGNVCRRKNQVNLAQSCLEANIPLVIIGKTLDGEEHYAENLHRIVSDSKNIRWIEGLKENSETLVEYFLNCFGFALISYREHQPIALLEAAVLNKPLLVADRAYAKQKYYSNCQVVDPDSIRSIKAGLEQIRNNPAKFYPDIDSLLACKGGNVAKAYLSVYNCL